MALADRNRGSQSPEGWFSLTGTVAHFAPEYSICATFNDKNKEINKEFYIIKTKGDNSQIFLKEKIGPLKRQK